MRKFSIPCDFGGTKAPFDVYIGNPKEGNHPIQNQAGWLSKERGGTVPPKVMESFTKLLEMAKKHGVSFEDLCAYALEVDVGANPNAKNPLAASQQQQAPAPQQQAAPPPPPPPAQAATPPQPQAYAPPPPPPQQAAVPPPPPPPVNAPQAPQQPVAAPAYPVPPQPQPPAPPPPVATPGAIPPPPPPLTDPAHPQLNNLPKNQQNKPEKG